MVSKTRIAALLVIIGVVSTATASWLMRQTPEEHFLRDIDGTVHGSLEHPAAGINWNVLFFLMSDCPIANQYAPELQRICMKYGPNGTQCFLVYVDPSMSAEAIRKHMSDFQYNSCCKGILDSNHLLVQLAG